MEAVSRHLEQHAFCAEVKPDPRAESRVVAAGAAPHVYPYFCKEMLHSNREAGCESIMTFEGRLKRSAVFRVTS